jgi:hypothetical protein
MKQISIKQSYIGLLIMATITGLLMFFVSIVFVGPFITAILGGIMLYILEKRISNNQKPKEENKTK